MRNVPENEPQQRFANCQAPMNACRADEDHPLDVEADASSDRLGFGIHSITRSGRPRCLLIKARFGAPLQPRLLVRHEAFVTKGRPASFKAISAASDPWSPH